MKNEEEKIPADRNLYNQIREDLDPFSDIENRGFISAFAGPGSGKTTFLLGSIRNLFGEYCTNAKHQQYIQEDGTITIIPAGQGNEAFETEEETALKTKNGEDIFYPNKDTRICFVAFNSKIVQEISKKTTAIEINFGNKCGKDFQEKDGKKINKLAEKNIAVKTSHALLWSMGGSMGLFDNGKTTDYAKGDFTNNDVQSIIENFSRLSGRKLDGALAEVSQKLLENKKLRKKAVMVGRAVINAYYNSSVLYEGRKTYAALIGSVKEELAAKGVEVVPFLQSLYPQQEKKIAKETFGLSADLILVDAFFRGLKKCIDEGSVSIGHSYYYKEVYLACMKDKELLLRLFSQENNPKKYFNVLFVDEAQDLTPIMIDLLVSFFNYAKEKSLNVSMAMVGDGRQAIYGFSKREDAFEAIERKLGKEAIKPILLSKTYRCPQEVCDFVNKAISVYQKKQATALKPIYPATDKAGFVYDEGIDAPTFAEYCISSGKTGMVIGRTNAEIMLSYVEAYAKLKKTAPESTKHLKVEAKNKKDFKDIVEKGIGAIDDAQLLEKIKLHTGKKNPKLEEVVACSELKDELPGYFYQIATLNKDLGESVVKEALMARSSPKANILFCTGHQSKGLESDGVYILDGITEAMFPEHRDTAQEALQSIFSIEGLEDIFPEAEPLESNKTEGADEPKDVIDNEEFNIFYVAATRAKEGVFLAPAMLSRFKNCIKNRDGSIDDAREIIASREGRCAVEFSDKEARAGEGAGLFASFASAKP